jgi:two-component system CitB family sensor kinase
VIGNLLDNAIDASAEGPNGRRAVQLRLHADAGEIVVEVADSGRGLPPELIESAFTRGWSTKVSSSAAGRGLGLALVNQVVRRHAGSVQVADSVLGGARFTVRLPLHETVRS